MIKAVLTVLVALAVAVLISGGIFLFLNNKCSDLGIDLQKTKEVRAVGGQTESDRAANSIPNSLIPPDIFRSIKQSIHSDEALKAQERRDWGNSFLCDVKATDVAIALFTFFLVVVGTWQGVQLKRTVDAAYEEFVSTHRPIIRVRRAVLGGVSGRLGAEWLSHGDDIEIEITVANVGGTPAHLVDGHYEIRFIRNNDPSVGFKGSVNALLTEHVTLAAGQNF
jgi:hypothetical protein